MKFIIASLFVIAAVHALPINNLQVELSPVEISAQYTSDAKVALKSCQGWFDAVCSDSLKVITNKFASQKITDCNSVDLEAAALAEKRLGACAKRGWLSSCKTDVEGLVKDLEGLGTARSQAKAAADKKAAAEKLQLEAVAADKKAAAEKLQLEAVAAAAAAAKAAEAAAKKAAAVAVAVAAAQAVTDLVAANSKMTAFHSILKSITAFATGPCKNGGNCWATESNKKNMPIVCNAWDSSIGQPFVMGGVKKFVETCALLKAGGASPDYSKVGRALNEAIDDIKARIEPKIVVFNQAVASAQAAAAQAKAISASL